MKKIVQLLILFFLTTSLNGQTNVSGTISDETWTKEKSPYIVKGDLLIATLTIQPGVKITFTGEFKFEILGKLIAVGSESEPILFTRETSNVKWKGVLFQNTIPGSIMEWCTIEFATNSGIRIIDSSPKIQNCTIRNNQSVNSGGGIYISNKLSSEIIIKKCRISNNLTPSNSSNGGGIWVKAENGIVRFEDCIIEKNQATMVDGNVGGGGCYVSGNVEFIGCSINNNVVTGNDGSPGGTSTGYGGGIYIENGSVVISKSNIYKNKATSYAIGGLSGNKGYASGGGIYINQGTVKLLNSIIASNYVSGSHGSTGGGVYVKMGKTNFENSTLAFNNIEALNNGSAEISVINSIIYFNNSNKNQISGTITITYSDIQGGIDGIGNINYNPVFYNDSTLMIIGGSPCIDAGNPNSLYNNVNFPPSLGGLRNDLGAHGGPNAMPRLITNSIILHSIKTPEFVFHQNYPNPFTSITNFEFDLKISGWLEIIIYDFQGHRILTLFRGYKSVSNHKLAWNIESGMNLKISSGTYFCVFIFNNQKEVKKISVLK